MVFKNLRIASASRAIEFRRDGLPVFYADLIHTVFVAVQRQRPSVAQQSGGLDRIQNDVGNQSDVGDGVLAHLATIREILASDLKSNHLGGKVFCSTTSNEWWLLFLILHDKRDTVEFLGTQ